MAPAPRRPPVRALRRLLLAALLVTVGGIVLLFLFGRSGRQGVQAPVLGPLDAAPGEDVTLIGEDFDYTYTEGKRPLFRIRGESVRADRQETLYLDGVGLTLYDEEGNAYEVQSREASFNRAQNEGRLRGRVFMRGPNGLELRTAVLQLRDKGRLLVSTRNVELRYGGAYVAKASRLRLHIPQEVYFLVGNVTVRGAPGPRSGLAAPVFLRAGQVFYERRRLLLRAERDVFLQRGQDEVRAQKVNAFLSQDERSLVFLRAFGQLAGRTVSTRAGTAPTRLRFTGDDLAVHFQPAPPGQGTSGVAASRVELTAAPRAPVLVETAAADGVTRTLRAPRLVGQLDQGALVQATAEQGVQMNEAGGRPPLARRASGRRAEGRFRADGQLAVLTLAEQVRFHDPEVDAEGDRAVLDLDAGRGEFFGAPVRATSARGRMASPHLVYTRDAGLLQADGGVRAMFERSSESADLAASPLGEGEGPVWVESREAFWREQPQGFLFRGDVRAWQGASLLRAGELRGDQEGEKRLTAKGGVKSLWVPDREPGSGRGGAPAGADQDQPPIEVTSDELLYRETAGILTYTGQVRVEQQARTLECRSLEVELDDAGEAERMTCTGDAKLTDPAAGRTVEGERAVYRLDERRIEMFGAPVAVRDRDGNRVQGRRLDYYVDDGRVEVRGQGER
ncbi:MAG TPA: LptA/OstA family protein [Thermoanaerobaculia bacterium]|nr:LptA/OstA family protein [Thermoanaerobaculia bacterium]